MSPNGGSVTEGERGVAVRIGPSWALGWVSGYQVAPQALPRGQAGALVGGARHQPAP